MACELIQLRLGQCLRLKQFLAALELTVAVTFGRFRRRQVGSRFLVVELDQHVALSDVLAFLEMNGSDAIGDLGGDVDGFVGAHGAQRFDFEGEFFEHRLRGRDRHFMAARRPTSRGPRARVVAVAARVVPGTSAQRDDGQSHSHDAIAIHEPATDQPGERVILPAALRLVCATVMRKLRRVRSEGCKDSQIQGPAPPSRNSNCDAGLQDCQITVPGSASEASGMPSNSAVDR